MSGNRSHVCSTAIPAIAVITAAIVGSCYLETATSLCEASGRRCAPGWRCALYADACIPIGGCGDGVTNGEEACDDGNLSSGDGCSFDCSSNEVCGNGRLDAEAGEACDDGNLIPGDDCNEHCLEESCGNGVLDRGEVCDDSNDRSFDGCRGDCRSNEACGNDILDVHLREECEFAGAPFPAPFDDTITCDNDCTLPRCGDGHLNAHLEQCDPDRLDMNGMALDSAACDRDCTPVVCGDAHVNQAAGEACEFPDLLFVRDTASCDGDCTLPRCGDGRTNVEANEGCDPGQDLHGNPVNTATCNSSCTVSRCGDGHANPVAGEGCDPGEDSNGHVVDGPACDYDCTVVMCGDGHVNEIAGEGCERPEDCSGQQSCVGCKCVM